MHQRNRSIRVASPVPLMHGDPDRSWITDPDPDNPKGTHLSTGTPKIAIAPGGGKIGDPGFRVSFEVHGSR